MVQYGNAEVTADENTNVREDYMRDEGKISGRE